MTERPSPPRLRAIRGSRFGAPPTVPKKVEGFAELAPPTRKKRRARKGQLVEPPGALLHLALAKGTHHREWFIGILGKEWTYTAIVDVDYFPDIVSNLTLAEARTWVPLFLHAIKQARAEGFVDAPLKHCGWSGLEDPGERILPERVG